MVHFCVQTKTAGINKAMEMNMMISQEILENWRTKLKDLLNIL